MTTELEVSNLSKSYGDTKVLEDVELEVDKGDFVCMLGRSGSGKSTLLQCIAGLEEYEQGEITGNWEQLGYVFQEDRLLNWKSVRKNIKLVLESMEIPEEEHAQRINKYLEMVNLENSANKYPLDLSGGMRQRVSIARALAIEPDILLMDEPFGSLDEITARELRESFLNIITELDQTVIFVTHNATEAAFLSTDVAIMGSIKPAKITKKLDNNIPYPRSIDSKEVINLKRQIVSEI